NRHLVTKYLGESLHVIARPRIIHFTVTAKFARHQVVCGFNSDHSKPVGVQFNKHLATDRLLCALQERFNIAHHRVVHLSFMHPVTVKRRQLVFPAQLPFGEGMLFQGMVRFDDNQWSSSLEPYASFNANYGVTHMDIASDTVWLGNGL